jgi:hypothetical protein
MSRALDTAKSQQSNSGPIPPFVAGKNKIINGDFSIWQRGTSFTSSIVNEYSVDRWRTEGNSLSTVISRQSFTSGQTDVPNNPVYFCRVTTNSSISSGQYWAFMQRIEAPSDMFAEASTTLTLSFWAKSVSGTIAANTFTFGDLVSSTGNPTITTSWQKIVYTYTTASSSYSGIYPLYLINLSSGKSAISIDIANVQLEIGSSSTPFATSTGTIQGELAACQRYYFRTQTGTGYPYIGVTVAGSSTTTYANIIHKVTMRSTPTSVDFSAIRWQAINNSGNISSASISDATPENTLLVCGTTGATTAQMNYVIGQTTSGYIGISAEL